MTKREQQMDKNNNVPISKQVLQQDNKALKSKKKVQGQAISGSSTLHLPITKDLNKQKQYLIV